MGNLRSCPSFWIPCDLFFSDEEIAQKKPGHKLSGHVNPMILKTAMGFCKNLDSCIGHALSPPIYCLEQSCISKMYPLVGFHVCCPARMFCFNVKTSNFLLVMPGGLCG